MNKQASEDANSPAEPSPPPLPGMGLRIQLMAFVGGAVLMGVEISGARFLAPHFGSSVYVWGALITVFLAALSGGYFLGGYLADRNPALHFLTFLAGGAGAWLLLVPQIAEPLCRELHSAGPRWGPLAAAGILFIVPAFLLGTVSPYCMRLFSRDLASTGRRAGTLYTLSTVGSLVGVFASTFVLVYLLSTPHVMFFFGIVLLAAGGAVMEKRSAPFFIYAPAALVVAALLITLPPEEVSLSEDETEASTIIEEVETPYHRIFVVEGRNISGYEQARYLQFDHYKESGIVLEPPYNAATRYTDLFHLLFLFHPRPTRILFIGGGGMIGPRKFREHYPFIEQVDVVEIDPEVVRIAQRHFFFKPDQRTRVHNVDGRVFLNRSTQTYDAVLLDIFSAGGKIPFHLTTSEFFKTVAQRLSPDGVCLMNVISSIEGPKSKIYHGVRRVFETWFGQTYTFPRLYHRMQTLEEFDRSYSRNVFLVGTRGSSRLSGEELAGRARERTDSGAIPKIFAIDMHGRNLLPADEPVLDPEVPLLTDEFNPIELWRFW